MTIALSINSRGAPPEAACLVPIATHEVFRRYWLPGCEELKLTWVPLFETGIPLGVEDIHDLLQELHRLKAWTELHSDEAMKVISPRIDRLVSELRLIEEEGEPDIYIG